MHNKTFFGGVISSLGFLIALAPLAVAQTYGGQPTTSGYTPYYSSQTTAQAAQQIDNQYPAYGFAGKGSTQQAASPVTNAGGGSGDYFAPLSKRIVTDPLYMPMRGQIYGTTAYTANVTSSDTINRNAIQSSNNSGVSNLLQQNLTYGIFDNLDVSLIFAYGFGTSNSDSTLNNTTKSNNSMGFYDPTFGVTYRALDQARSYPVDVDLSFAYTPDMLDAKAAGAGNQGNFAQGYQSAAFTLAVGREMRNFTIEGFVTPTYIGDRSTQLPLANGSSTSTSNDYWNYEFGVNTQTRLTERFSVNAGAGYNFRGSTNVSNPQINSAYQSNPENVMIFNAAVNYHFIPNRLVGSLTYGHNDNGDVHYSYSSPSVYNQANENSNNNVFGARLSYVFN